MITDRTEINSKDYFQLLEKIARSRHRKIRQSGIHHVELGDLIREGYLGLKKAIEIFNPEKSPSFEKYAFYIINYSISNYLRKMDLISKEKRGAIKRIRAATAKLEQSLGRSPYETEIAMEMNISLDQLRELQKSTIKEISLDKQSNSDEGDISLLIKLADYQPDLDANIDRPIIAAALDDCLNSALEPQERQVLLLMDLQDFKGPEVLDLIDRNIELQRVHYLRRRARIKMAGCLKKKGVGITVKRCKPIGNSRSDPSRRITKKKMGLIDIRCD